MKTMKIIFPLWFSDHGKQIRRHLFPTICLPIFYQGQDFNIGPENEWLFRFSGLEIEPCLKDFRTQIGHSKSRRVWFSDVDYFSSLCDLKSTKYIKDI
jgi:hypothetical protein